FFAVELARVDAFAADDAFIALQFGGELAVADIDGIDAPRAALQQDLSEPAGRCADVETNEPNRRQPETIQRRRQLQRTARYIRMRLNVFDRGICRHQIGWLVHDLAIDAHVTRTNRRLGLG